MQVYYYTDLNIRDLVLISNSYFAAWNCSGKRERAICIEKVETVSTCNAIALCAAASRCLHRFPLLQWIWIWEIIVKPFLQDGASRCRFLLPSTVYELALLIILAHFLLANLKSVWYGIRRVPADIKLDVKYMYLKAVAAPGGTGGTFLPPETRKICKGWGTVNASASNENRY